MSLAHALLVNQFKCRLSSCLLQIRYACATIATDTRHTTLICACKSPTRSWANFPSLLAHFKCETCAVTLGARTYRTSKRVKDKGYHTQRQQESEVIPTSTTTCSPLECPCCAPSDREPPDISRHAICLARASKPKKKRRKPKKAKEPVIAAPALDAAPLLVAGVAPRLVHPPQHRMHIDYAHSITLGRNKEQYHLMIVRWPAESHRARPHVFRAFRRNWGAETYLPRLRRFVRLSGTTWNHVVSGWTVSGNCFFWNTRKH